MKSLYLRVIIIIVCSISSSLVIADKKTLSFSSWTPVAQTLNLMVEATETEFPEVSINVKTYNYNTYLIDLHTRAKSDMLSDLIGLEPGALTQQYRKHLIPIQGCAQKVWGKNWKNKFSPLAIEQARLGNPQGDKNFYGLPILIQTINLWYTVPVLEAMNAEPPKTYQELKLFAKKANSMGYAPIIIGARDGWIRRDFFMQIMHSIAPGLMTQFTQGEVKFTDKAFVEGLQIWKMFFDDGIFQEGALGLSHYPAAVDIIESGRAAIFPMGTWWQQQASVKYPTSLSKNLSGYRPFKFPDISGKGQSEDVLGGIDLMIGISKNTKDFDLACKVLTDWAGGRGAQELINTFNDLPAFKGLVPQEFGNKQQEKIWKLFTEEWAPEVKYPRQLASSTLRQGLEDILAAVAAGDLTPLEGARIMQASYNSERKTVLAVK